ncbi:hypothetical protein CJF42_03590 [Pseudoalteromonas sp. NBT06-2]|uniref:hypothetical protein n=1 Tax=Pseudoalteromonas sp. NBT06-2 TaxID=2025950 RepID=UPI000BA74B24|nr:hypothetical protein [Pseudoalteromonas sp. NBT06-2]PAJ75726.1 hypothetical protein CJF42_03590 [Pseudoalteromonas sp. NBT06-2]
MSNVERNDNLRSQLSKSLDELQQLEDKQDLILSFSNGICLLMKENGGAHPLLSAVSTYKINRETDPFCNHSAGMFTYCQATMFFKISHHQNTAHIDIGLYSETGQMRQQRNNYQWYALKAVIDF